MIRGFIPLPVYLGILAFLWWRVTTGFSLKSREKWILAGILSLIPVFFLVFGYVSQRFRVPVLCYLHGFLMGFLLMVGCFLVIEWILSAMSKKYRKIWIGLALIVPLVLSGYGLVQGSAHPVVREVNIPIQNLPAEAEGFIIVQLSDLHLASIPPVAWLEKVVEKTNSLNPDLIVFTGDLIGGATIPGIEDYSLVLKRLKARFGVLAVTGNHDHGNRIRTYKRVIGETGIKVLHHEVIQLANGIFVAGIDDPIGTNHSWPNLTSLLKDVPEESSVILLSHRGKVFPEAAKLGVDLILSAHTHAGQFPPLSLLYRLYYKYIHGIHQIDQSFMYSSSGSGTWEYLPLRIFSNNEIVKLTLFM